MSALIGRSVDAVLDQMDVDHIVSRIDVDRLVHRIDWNKVLDTVDMDRLLERVDLNAVLERVDIDAVLQRSNLEGIIARSSSGIWQQVVDLIRINIVRLDTMVYRMARCKCRVQEIHLPPKPIPMETGINGRPGMQPQISSRNMAVRIVEVQGAFSGVSLDGVIG